MLALAQRGEHGLGHPPGSEQVGVDHRASDAEIGGRGQLTPVDEGRGVVDQHVELRQRLYRGGDALLVGDIESNRQGADAELGRDRLGPGSAWSRANRGRIERLETAGLFGTAKKPETRARRIEETARLAAEDIRANQRRQPKRKDAG